MLFLNRISRWNLISGSALICLVSVAVIGVWSQTGAEPLASDPIESLGKFKVALRSGYTYSIEIALDHERSSEAFPEDWLVLTLRDHRQATIASKPFHSSYQQFRIQTIDLDGDGRREFIFVLGQERGTSARREVLYIERFDGSLFRELISTPVSDFYAPGRRWWYSIAYGTAKGSGVHVEMKLHVDDMNENVSHELVPTEKLKTFRWTREGQADAKAGVRMDSEFRE